MKISANDTFCLYLGWILVAFGSLLLMSVGLIENKIEIGYVGIGMISLGISTQLMAFQHKKEEN